ncbi:amidohydrolase [Sphingomonas glaciei]|uniref:Amidohydrolase n=1 Tax=Sphingomonas glaciei TaxID=2938948 RepID=A0ABY5MZX6_9SPHN|nr:amidohydrolase [Sphingomonas glaciei]UUR09345.1 amidohydrolase [Sphingomonas glaciei]
MNSKTLVLLASAWCALVIPTTASADNVVIINAKIFTGSGVHPQARAVVVTGDRISFVGSTTAARARSQPNARIIDAGGRLLTPGLIEAHTHLGPESPGQQVSMPALMWPGPSAAQAIQAVRAAAASGTGWISGTIGPATLSGERDWRSELDAVAGGRPVRLRAWWGHGTLLNSAALRQLGISDRAPDPIGGWYGRRADGTLNGLVREQAEVLVAMQLTKRAPLSAGVTAFREAAAQYAKWGVTTIHQMAHNYRVGEITATLHAAQPSLRWSVYGWASPERQPRDAWAEFASPPLMPASARLAGIKWILDSTPIERDAFQRTPYADRPGQRGRSNYSDAELRQILEGGLRGSQQLALHVVGDAEVQRLFTAMEKIAPAARWRAKRVRIEHGDGITADLLPAAKRLGVVVVQNPLHILPDKDETGRPWLENRLGEERARRFLLFRSLLRAGVPLSLGSDAGGEAANPFLNMMFAVRYDRNPVEALTREQALAAYTAGGAFAEGQEHQKGRIAVGAKADLALLSQDVLTVPLDRLPATVSLLTVVDGVVVHEGAAGLQR